MKILLPVILLFIATAFNQAQAQFCTANANWTFDPPPVNGMLEMNQTVQVCVDLTMYSPGSSAWLSGLELDFPPAWQLSTLNVISIPQPCSPGEGEWVYLDTLSCPPYFFGPGFYFDRNNDGNLCNNFGDQCAFLPENMTFCFDITLAGDCPTDEENLFPRIKVISDDYFGDFPSTCQNPIYVQPAFDNLSLNCCGVSAGTSPGTIALCEPQCLFDLLENADAGGTWTGPSGYIDPQGCGFFDANTDPLGVYMYTVYGGLCQLSSTITITESNLGIQGQVYECYGTAHLFDGLPFGYPINGIWTDPNGATMAGDLIDFSNYVTGVYTYSFFSDTGCLMTVGVEVLAAFTTGVPVSTIVCESIGDFCPFDVFQSLQPSGVNVSTGGQWIVYDDEGNYLSFFLGDECLNYDVLQAFGSPSLEFVYILGEYPCTPAMVSFTIYLDSQDQTVSAMACPGIIDLEPYLPLGTPQGGFWTNYVEEWESVFDCTPCAEGSFHDFLYTYDLESGCTGSVAIGLIIGSPDDGGDYSEVKCGDGSVLQLQTLLPDGAMEGGQYYPSSTVVLLPENSGIYTYTTNGANCGETMYSFNLNITQNLTHTNPITTLTGNDDQYTVSFTIDGGEPPYMVDGGVIVGADFVSTPIPLGTSYSFAISDSSPCPDITITGGYTPPCNLSAGESPGQIDLCQPEPFCLFNQLTNADTGGVWTGPPGWTDTGCGLVDPSTNPPGDYYYIVSDGAGCADTAMVTLVPIELGLLYGITSCTDDGVDLYTWYEATESSFWMGPGYPQVLDTITNQFLMPDQYSPGIYTYVYYDDDCLTTVENFVIFNNAYSGNTDVEPVSICIDEMNFSPAEALGITDPYVGGNWIIYDSTGTGYLDFIPNGSVTFTGEELLLYGSSVVLTYIQGAPPCTPVIVDLYVSIDVGNTQLVEDTVCQSDGVVDLSIFLPATIGSGGVWTDQAGNVVISMIDVSVYEPGSVQVFYYNSLTEAGCDQITEVWLTINSVGAGDDYNITMCGNGDMIDLYALLPADVDQTGTFPVSQILAIPANSGAYTYTITTPTCGVGSEQAVYTLTFTEPFTSQVEATCNPGGTTFNATLQIQGGMSPYTINGETVIGNTYEASALAVADGEATFLVADAGLCDPIQISVTVPDTDGDGVCDDQEITGCMDPTAINYNPNATDPGYCFFEIGGQMSQPTPWSDDDQTGFEKPATHTNFQTDNAPGHQLEMLIFPNPAINQATLHIRGLSATQTFIEITDILGSVRHRSEISTANTETQQQINLQAFPPGIYLVHLINAEKEITQKIIITQ